MFDFSYFGSGHDATVNDDSHTRNYRNTALFLALFCGCSTPLWPWRGELRSDASDVL